MADKRMMITGEKESFLIRVLVKKTIDAGIDCVYAPWDIDGLNKGIEDCVMVTVFMDRGDRPSEDAVHFLADKMEEDGIKMMIVGDPEEIKFITDRVNKDHIYKIFERPIDNADYVKTVTDVFSKVASGEFRKSILVVDDDPNYLSLVREWLKDKYKVAMASSGLQAIKWLGKNKADLILLDHEMPVTSGPQVLEMLRSDEDTRSIPVIFLTGKRDKESVMAVVALRPEGYFIKTISKEELLEKISEFFVMHR